MSSHISRFGSDFPIWNAKLVHTCPNAALVVDVTHAYAWQRLVEFSNVIK